MFKFLKKEKQIKVNVQNPDNIYSSLRDRAFSTTPKDLNVVLDNDEQVYGAIVDMCTDKGNIATMVCFFDGTASLYFSNGGGILGSGQHEKVGKAVVSFLYSIHQVLHIMKLTNDFSRIPEPNHHIFYLFTRVGKYYLDLDLDDYKKTKETHFLFGLSQMVLTEIRETNEKLNKPS